MNNEIYYRQLVRICTCLSWFPKHVWSCHSTFVSLYFAISYYYGENHPDSNNNSVICLAISPESRESMYRNQLSYSLFTHFVTRLFAMCLRKFSFGISLQHGMNTDFLSGSPVTLHQHSQSSKLCIYYISIYWLKTLHSTVITTLESPRERP